MIPVTELRRPPAAGQKRRAIGVDGGWPDPPLAGAMPAMDASETPPIDDDRRRPGLLTGLILAGSALLFAACSTLEPPGAGAPGNGAPGGAASTLVSDHGTGRTAQDPRSKRREPREATRLPDQVGPDADADADVDEAGHRGRGRLGEQGAARVGGRIGARAAGRAGNRDAGRAAGRPALDPARESGSADAAWRGPGPSPAAIPVVAERGSAGPDATGPEAIGQDAAPDAAAAAPRTEPLHPTANRPYTVASRRYHPMKSRRPYRQRGMASWYGRPFHGRRTATGERFDMTRLTAAHPTLPLPSWVRVTHSGTGESVVVRVNDRGPFADNRIIDLSHAAAKKLGFLDDGLVAVELELLLPGDDADVESAD